MRYTTDNFDIEVDLGDYREYGWFEHHEYGDECGGGLWFDGTELIDYDGVATLPKEVWDKLQELGYFFDGEI